jgi:2-polyprenyl-3-methyl-5-hydroxy-6-metoxy-1,4-benzoquinol methylase
LDVGCGSGIVTALLARIMAAAAQAGDCVGGGGGFVVGIEVGTTHPPASKTRFHFVQSQLT